MPQRHRAWLQAAFEILVVRVPGTTTKITGQPKVLMQLSDGQPLLFIPCSMYGQPNSWTDIIKGWSKKARSHPVAA